MHFTDAVKQEGDRKREEAAVEGQAAERQNERRGVGEGGEEGPGQLK